MFENTIMSGSILAEDYPRNDEQNNYSKIEKEIINTLSENQFAISQARYMFNNILMQFERYMPVTNHRKF